MITMQDVQGGYDAWAAKPHNAKWVRKIDGTPIPNDIVVNIFEALKASRSAEAGKPVVKGLEWVPSAFDTQYGLIIRIAKTPFGPYKILKGTQGRYEVYFGNAPYSGSMDGEDQAKAWAQSDYEARVRSALSTPADGEPVVHADDLAVDRFAIAMKAKLAEKRGQGLGGWDDPEQCHIDYLVSILMQQIHERAVPDPIDIANIAMMIHERGETPDYGR